MNITVDNNNNNILRQKYIFPLFIWHSGVKVKEVFPVEKSRYLTEPLRTLLLSHG